MQNLVTPDGEVRKLWRGQPAVGSMEELQAQRLLLQLGNAVVAAYNNKWRDGADLQLKEGLQVCAAANACVSAVCCLSCDYGPRR